MKKKKKQRIINYIIALIAIIIPSTIMLISHFYSVKKDFEENLLIELELSPYSKNTSDFNPYFLTIWEGKIINKSMKPISIVNFDILQKREMTIGEEFFLPKGNSFKFLNENNKTFIEFHQYCKFYDRSSRLLVFPIQLDPEAGFGFTARIKLQVPNTISQIIKKNNLIQDTMYIHNFNYNFIHFADIDLFGNIIKKEEKEDGTVIFHYPTAKEQNIFFVVETTKNTIINNLNFYNNVILYPDSNESEDNY